MQKLHKQYTWPKVCINTSIFSKKIDRYLTIEIRTYVEKVNEFGTRFYIPLFYTYQYYYTCRVDDLKEMLNFNTKCIEDAISKVTAEALRAKELYNINQPLTDLLNRKVIIEDNGKTNQSKAN